MPINPKRPKGISFSDFTKKTAKKPTKPMRQRKSHYRGKVHKLSLTDYLASIFYFNGKCTQAQRASDLRIAEMVIEEYSAYPKFSEEWKNHGIAKVVYYRNFYNRGDAIVGTGPPEQLSHRYNFDGVMLTSKGSDYRTEEPKEWIKRQEAYYTAHLIKMYGTIVKVPKDVQAYEWFLGADASAADKKLVAEATQKIKVRANAMKNRHTDKREETK